MKLHAPACERNRDPITLVLQEILPTRGDVLEIGSGTGQHIVHFAARFPDLNWQPSDLEANLPSIEAWRSEAALHNLASPKVVDLLQSDPPSARADVVLCINTIHIVPMPGVRNLFEYVGQTLRPQGIFFAYGPYRYRDRPIEPSNAAFDAWLKARDPASGVRDFDLINDLATGNGLVLEGDLAMPANNRAIYWRKHD